MIKLTAGQKQIADYMINENKAALNRISPDCVAPLIAIRQAVRNTAKSIGVTALKSRPQLSQEDWIAITRWIRETFYATKR